MKRETKAGLAIAVLLVAAAIYWIYLQATAPLPSDLPPGYLRGNVTIAGMSENETLSISPYLLLGITNTDGWKYGSPVFVERDGNHYSYNMSVFPGHFKLNLTDDKNFTSPDLPMRITIESGKTTVADVTLLPATSPA